MATTCLHKRALSHMRKLNTEVAVDTARYWLTKGNHTIHVETVLVTTNMKKGAYQDRDHVRGDTATRRADGESNCVGKEWDSCTRMGPSDPLVKQIEL